MFVAAAGTHQRSKSGVGFHLRGGTTGSLGPAVNVVLEERKARRSMALQQRFLCEMQVAVLGT